MGGKNAVQIRSALRTDLKDSGALWSDAELIRSVERAVSDLSRMLPLEKVYEKSLQFTVSSEAFTSPKDTDIDYIVVAQTLNGKVAGDTFTRTTTQPDYPRVVTVAITDADTSITNFTIIVKGTDAKGKAIEESFHFGNGLSQTGKKEFKYIREVELDQVAGTAAAEDVLNVGIGAFTNVWAELANKPIKYASETISSMTRNTDFFMDYANGRIKCISGGSMLTITAYTISYTLGQLWLDLNNIPDLIRVESVIYPVGTIPQSIVPWDIWGNILSITGAGEAEEQQSMAEDKHIAVYYDAEHQPPTDFNSGSYPEFLENTVLLAAGAYALFIYTLKYEHLAATDFASARTALGNLGAIHTLIATALGKVTTHVAEMSTALGLAAAQAVLSAAALVKINGDGARTYLTDANTALDAAATILTATDSPTGVLSKVDTYLAGATESAKARLLLITTDVANLRTAVATAIDAAKTTLGTVNLADVGIYLGNAVTALGKVDTYLVSNTNEDSKYWLTKITTDIAGLRTAVLTAVDALNTYIDVVGAATTGDLAKADLARANYMGATANYVDGTTAPGIKKYLDDGDALINTVTAGGENERTPEVYATFASIARSALVTPHEQDRNFYLENAARRTNAALGYAQEAAERLSNLRSYIEQADAWGRVAAGFVGEAVQRISAALQAANRERVKIDQAATYVAEANARLANLESYINQAMAYTRISDSFIAEARERIGVASAFIAEASQRVSIADRYIAEASGRVATANAYTEEANGRLGMANAFVAEANGRTAEMDRHIAEADRYTGIAVQNLALADRFRSEAEGRRNEAWNVWRDRKQYIGDFTQSAVRQMPVYQKE